MNLRVIIAAAVAVLTVAALADKTYIVKKGDTLSGIAAKTGCKATTLAKRNGLKNHQNPKPGMKLVIPSSIKSQRVNIITTQKARINRDGVVVRKGAKTGAPKITNVSKGKDARILTRIGAWYKVKFVGGTIGYVRGDYLNAAKSTPARFITAASSSKQKAKGYIVVKGDNDIKICHKLGTSKAALYAANKAVNWNRLKPGQVIRNPGKPIKAKYSSGDKVNYIATKYVKVNKDRVVVRSGPATNKAKIAQVDSGRRATVLARSGAWYKVKFAGGTIGFVRSDYLNVAKTPAPSRAVLLAERFRPTDARRSAQPGRQTEQAPVTYAAGSADGTALVAEAKKYLGTRYVWGGESTRGFDCSGFVRYVYRRAEGVNLPRTSREQYRTGVAVQKSDLKPGDLLAFHTGATSQVNHVGIYIGGGKFIHSSSGKGRVRIDSVATGFYATRLSRANRVKASLKKTKGSVTKPSEVSTKPMPTEDTKEVATTEKPKENTAPEIKAPGSGGDDKKQQKNEGKGGG